MSDVEGYAILRMVKHKGRASIRAMSVHALREKPVPNADPLAPKPLCGGAKTTHALFEKLDAGIALAQEKGGPQGFTKASSPVLEFLVTSGHEKMQSLSFDQQNKYFQDSLKFLAAEFGGKENILSWQVHRDEHTQHMSVFVMPLDRTTFRFSAAKFIGGPGGMGRRLDRFVENVGKQFGMKRGETESTAEHIPIGEFYKALAAGAEVPKLIEAPPKPSATDRLKPGYAEKLKAHQDAIAARKKQEIELVKLANIGTQMSPKMIRRQAERYQSAKQMQAHMKTQEAELKKLRDAAAADKKDAVSARDAALTHEKEARALAQSADRIFMSSEGAKMLDLMSKSMDPTIVAMVAKNLQIKLVPGRGLLDQIRKQGRATDMLSAAKILTFRLEELEQLSTPEHQVERHRPQPPREG